MKKSVLQNKIKRRVETLISKIDQIQQIESAVEWQYQPPGLENMKQDLMRWLSETHYL